MRIYRTLCDFCGKEGASWATFRATQSKTRGYLNIADTNTSVKLELCPNCNQRLQELVT